MRLRPAITRLPSPASLRTILRPFCFGEDALKSGSNEFLRPCQQPLKTRGNRPHLESADRVALGGVPPRAPTDPYVRDYRIRFLSYDFATR